MLIGTPDWLVMKEPTQDAVGLTNFGCQAFSTEHLPEVDLYRENTLNSMVAMAAATCPTCQARMCDFLFYMSLLRFRGLEQTLLGRTNH